MVIDLKMDTSDSPPTAESPYGDNEENFFDGYDDSDLLKLQQLKNYFHPADANEIYMPSTESWVDADQCRRKTRNVVIERIDKDRFNVPAPLPMKTPAKLAKNSQRGTAPEAFTNLDRQCKGIPFTVYSDEGKPCQMRCNFLGCPGKTSWYCAGCKQWFCMEKNIKPDMSDVLNFGVGSITIQGNEKLFQPNCYHRKHVQVSEEE